MRVAKLREDLRTPHGIYSEGSEVIVRTSTNSKVQLCLDRDGFHMGNKCHAVTVPWHFIQWSEGPDMGAFHRRRQPVRFD
jgi:hypothetical protein